MDTTRTDRETGRSTGRGTTWAAVLAAGSGTRLLKATDRPKQFLDYDGLPLFWHSAATFASCPGIHGLVLVFPADSLAENRLLVEELKARAGLDPDFPVLCVAGGARRQDSVLAALRALPDEAGHVLVHDSARPFVTRDLVRRLLDALDGGSCAVIPGLRVTDTIKVVEKREDGDAAAGECVVGTPVRSTLRAVQTPQGFRKDALLAAHDALNTPDHDVTDDASLMEEAGHRVLVVEGDPANVKITNPEDLALLKTEDKGQACLPCTGFGYDVHRYGGTRPLVLGGVRIPCDLAVEAHSDGDVLLHALMDALLGLAGLGDIGEHFPDTDPAYDGARSTDLLGLVLRRLAGLEVRPIHADLTVVAQKPRIKEHKELIRRNVARLLGLPVDRVNVKATTEELLGFTGAVKGIKAYAVVTGLRPDRA